MMFRTSLEKASECGKWPVVAIVFSVCLAVAAFPSFAREETQDEPQAATQLQPPREKGFYLGIRFVGSSLHVDESDDDIFFVKDDGGGIQFQAGYRFNSVFSLELSLGGANHDTSDPRISADLGMVQLFAHYRFAPGKPFRPYIKGGLGGYGLRLEGNDVEATVEGGGIALGGGFDYFFSRHFSIGVDFTHNIIEYNEAELSIGGMTVGTAIDEDGAMSSLGLALTYYF